MIADFMVLPNEIGSEPDLRPSLKTKKFDCVEMKRRGAAIVQNKIAGMTQEQELEYWRKSTEAWKKGMSKKQR